jgi:hypothetical protein
MLLIYLLVSQLIINFVFTHFKSHKMATKSEFLLYLLINISIKPSSSSTPLQKIVKKNEKIQKYIFRAA